MAAQCSSNWTGICTVPSSSQGRKARRRTGSRLGGRDYPVSPSARISAIDTRLSQPTDVTSPIISLHGWRSLSITLIDQWRTHWDCLIDSALTRLVSDGSILVQTFFTLILRQVALLSGLSTSTCSGAAVRAFLLLLASQECEVSTLSRLLFLLAGGVGDAAVLAGCSPSPSSLWRAAWLLCRYAIISVSLRFSSLTCVSFASRILAWESARARSCQHLVEAMQETEWGRRRTYLIVGDGRCSATG
ncbi:hypothetical protein D1007_03132 [Hordeum vulgare]|nr:hypothetical protein D1007_03132 [Hordeum vulgare]